MKRVKSIQEFEFLGVAVSESLVSPSEESPTRSPSLAGIKHQSESGSDNRSHHFHQAIFQPAVVPWCLFLSISAGFAYCLGTIRVVLNRSNPPPANSLLISSKFIQAGPHWPVDQRIFVFEFGFSNHQNNQGLPFRATHSFGVRVLFMNPAVKSSPATPLRRDQGLLAVLL
jgi:hypothetical protein